MDKREYKEIIMDRKINVILPITASTAAILEQRLQWFFEYLPIKKIVLIGHKDVQTIIPKDERISFIDEDRLIEGLSLERVKKIKKDLTGTDKRSGWYYQQFLKMAYALVTEDEYYLVWDSDTIPTRLINFFNDEGKPIMGYRNYVSYDKGFFGTIETLLGITKKVQDSFIAEHMLINASIMKKMISDIEQNETVKGKQFFEKILNAIDKKEINLTGFSEFETYACYVLEYYRDFYEYRFWKNLRNGKIYIGENIQKEQLDWIGEEFCSVSIEHFDKQWLIFKMFGKGLQHIPFAKIYKIFNPLIQCVYFIRMSVRSVVRR